MWFSIYTVIFNHVYFLFSIRSLLTLRFGRRVLNDEERPTFVKHLYNVGPTSKTLVQRCTNIIQMFCVHWGACYPVCLSARPSVRPSPRPPNLTCCHNNASTQIILSSVVWWISPAFTEICFLLLLPRVVLKVGACLRHLPGRGFLVLWSDLFFIFFVRPTQSAGRAHFNSKCILSTYKATFRNRHRLDKSTILG